MPMIFSSEVDDLLEPEGSPPARSGRQRFLESLDADIHIAMAQGECLAILLIDLRKFLTINLAHGYKAGDEILHCIPNLLRTTIRKASAVERLGDNCFGLIIPAMPSTALLPIAAEKIRARLAQPMRIRERQVALECHIASAAYPAEGQLGEQLLLNAERMLVDVKARKYSDTAVPVLVHNEGHERWKIEKLLHHALDRGELELYYQPKVRLQDRAPASAEALLRWNSGELGFVRPDEFISIAEESSLINHITEWALKTAIRQRSEIAADTRLSVAVNVSASDIYDPGTVHSLESIMAIWGLDPEYLTIEVTESVIMESPDLVMRNLEQIRKLGIKLSLDDFGTGYSSLAYFKSLPIDEIKIDKSFIQTMATDTDDAMLVETIINLAHQFNLTVVAEGVEDSETLAQLVALNCDYAQGYYFSRPVPAQEFASWLSGYRADQYWPDS